MARAVRGEARSVSLQRLGVFNYLNARERIMCHPEFAAVTAHLAREESTRAHREDSESIQPLVLAIAQGSYNLVLPANVKSLYLYSRVLRSTFRARKRRDLVAAIEMPASSASSFTDPSFD
jgi:hypothetical protein